MSAINRIKPHISAARAAALLDISTRTLVDLVKKGKVQGVLTEGRVIIEIDSLQAYLDARTIRPKET